MRVEDHGHIFEVPESLIESFRLEFMNEDHDYISLIRDSTWMIKQTVAVMPRLLDDEEIVGDIIKAHAMREALSRIGKLYDA